ncbi:hypothetical protein E2C01_022563 [Portunus trituberculatus]|uniref:Uncharacterized protein n=1 Tax=Portunus trituberculatus TaxID=210409 RepID=A0A5B7E7M0_PORTR|nr:hypothetical protein [Portunus trituberculatus]
MRTSYGRSLKSVSVIPAPSLPHSPPRRETSQQGRPATLTLTAHTLKSPEGLASVFVKELR